MTFPALLAAGLPPVIATATNLAALTPSSFLAAYADRNLLPPFDRALAGLVAASIAGAVIGAALLMVTSARLFEFLVPILLGFATLLFGFGDHINKVWRERSLARHGHEPQVKVTSLPMLLPVSVYGGYFGAGLGVLLVAVMQLATKGEYRSANTVKNLVAALNGLAAVAVFTVKGAIHWPMMLLMTSGALFGAQIGVRIARHASREVMRFVVIVIGALLTIVYAWRYWF